ncbi:MAG TPA: hypothetical protein VGN12_08520 [Pirellulales bacterium]|jgi:hypothetical protein
MADNTELNAMSGGDVVADEDIAGVKHQLVKMEWGASGTANKVDTATGKPLPVQLRSPTGTDLIGTAGTASAAVLSVQGIASGTAVAVSGTFWQTTQPISAASLPLPTGAASAAKQPALGTAGSASSDVITIQGIASGTVVPVSVATIPSHAVTNAGTFAVQAAQTGTWNITNVSGTISLPTGASTETSLAALLATAGATSGAAVITDANGTMQQYLRGLVKQWISSTLTLASRAASSAVTLTRTADTNGYTANDILGSATGSTAALSFTNIGPSGAEVTISSVELEIDSSGVISGETSYRLYLYNVTPQSAVGDNGAFDLPSGDRASFLGYVDLGTPVDLGSTLYVRADNVNTQVKLSGTGLFGYLVTAGAYTPASARVYKITLHAVF